MQVVKQSTKQRPRISLILLDWGVRESFHLLHYLKGQSIPPEDFEVILVEYYSVVSARLKEFEQEIDTLAVLDMPKECYYHKHLMYNVGIFLSKGEILMFADSDAMVRPTFLETAIKAFDREPNLVYHMDQFRNIRHDFYPFCYPTFEEVLGDGCINNEGGKTKGVLDRVDSIHTRNYGACMCARREDVIAIGGADEDQTYLGHICGPYDMTFRLMHLGRRLHWEEDEYLYHTWHPGSDGIDNYLGPHDGRNMSMTAFGSLCSGRVRPLVENQAIRALRTGTAAERNGNLWRSLIDPDYVQAFDRARVGTSAKQVVQAPIRPREWFASYHGFAVYRIGASFYGIPESFGPIDSGSAEWRSDERVIEADSFGEIRRLLDEADGVKCLETVGVCNICSLGQRFAVVPIDLGIIDFHIPSHRGNPRIVWSDDLEGAREASKEIGRQGQPAGSPPTNRTSSPGETSYLEAVSDLLVVVEKRIGGMEDRFGGIESGLQGLQHGMREGLERPEKRIVELEDRLGGIESGLEGLRQELREGLERPEKRIVELEGRFGGIESGLQGLRHELREGLVRPEKRILELEGRLGGIESGLQGLGRETREGLVRSEKRIVELEDQLGGIESGLQGLARETREALVRPEKRIAELEREQAAIAAGLGSIYRSRTWRALTWVGGALLRALGTRRG